MEKLLERGLKFLYFSSHDPKIPKMLELEHPFEKMAMWVLDLHFLRKKPSLDLLQSQWDATRQPSFREPVRRRWAAERWRGWDLPRSTVLVIWGFNTVDWRTREQREKMNMHLSIWSICLCGYSFLCVTCSQLGFYTMLKNANPNKTCCPTLAWHLISVIQLSNFS